MGVGSATGSFWGSREGAAPDGFRDCADFLRGTLGISRAEARRRLALADLVLCRMSPTGAALPARLETLSAVVETGLVSGRAATIVSQAVQRVQSFATPEEVESMEDHLTRQAVESDEDILRVVARRWEGVLDQDGQEPTDKVLRARQGVFLRGRRHGLHVLEIGATDEQFEHLATVMNTATNPRMHADRASTAGAAAAADGIVAAAESAGESGASGAAAESGPGSDIGYGAELGTGFSASSGWGEGSDSGRNTDLYGDPEGATRAQMLLEGLVSACKIALSTTGLPATGGHRPQVMVTIDYQDLIDQTQNLTLDLPGNLARGLTGQTQRAKQRPGHTVFAGQASARTIRRIACDADIIPIILGGAGQVLDLGRAQRLFPPHLRRALVARDKGCAFPDCTIPAPWCEAHHIDPWSRGGRTSISNGALLCSRHHHLIHQGTWRIEPRSGIAWFHAPGYPGRAGAPRTNTYWHTGRIVRETNYCTTNSCTTNHTTTNSCTTNHTTKDDGPSNHSTT
ncbi:HNH endonuclease signature motif containing protein [Arthrobacter sp. TmT3-37]